ncbi:hypothetical protein ETD83_31240 [Actinomadura soli]|uniref:Uncharacterized protein n=1 Tax=Actinomadura soli TaxID=2508997 RepID=A0A5C4J3T8_9ACTN|nr:hypothetical protein ETD83_31240 [Actinomadura soli]
MGHQVLLGKETTSGQSPTLYATDRDSYVVQGWIVTDPEIVNRLSLSHDETIVEVPPRLMTHLAKDGLSGEITNVMAPSSTSTKRETTSSKAFASVTRTRSLRWMSPPMRPA